MYVTDQHAPRKLSMAFYVYREGNVIKVEQCDVQGAQALVQRFGGSNLGSRPFASWDEARRYRDRWRQKLILNPRCTPPYSADKD